MTVMNPSFKCSGVGGQVIKRWSFFRFKSNPLLSSFVHSFPSSLPSVAPIHLDVPLPRIRFLISASGQTWLMSDWNNDRKVSPLARHTARTANGVPWPDVTAHAHDRQTSLWPRRAYNYTKLLPEMSGRVVWCLSQLRYTCLSSCKMWGKGGEEEQLTSPSRP